MHDDAIQPPPRPAAKPVGWFSSLDRGTLQSVSLSIIAIVMLLAALEAASLIAVPAVLALLCALALSPWVKWLERSGAPASLCAALVVGGLLVGAASTVYSLAPSAEAWNDRVPQMLREMERRTREIATALTRTFEDVADQAPDLPRPVTPAVPETPAEPADPDASDDPPASESSGDAVDRLVEGGQRLLTDWAIGAPKLVAAIAFWAMLTFFLLRDRVMLARWGMSLVPGASARRAVGRAMRDVRSNVARYLLAISAVNLGLGVCVAVGFHLLGVANAPLWGVAAGLLNFMPFIGIAIMAMVTLGVGIVSFDDPVVAFAPFAVVVGLNVIESQIVTPIVVGSRTQIAPIAVFVAIAFGAWFWGAAGALVATPTLIVAVAFVRRLNAAEHLPYRRRKI